MRTLLEDGISKAAQGLTTLDEILRVAVTDGSAAWGEGEPSRKGAAAPYVPDVDASQSTDPGASIVSTDGNVLVSHKGKPRVLVVEDDGTISVVVKYFLELEGFEVLIAKEGCLAWK
jgi:hypothetical protein